MKYILMLALAVGTLFTAKAYTIYPTPQQQHKLEGNAVLTEEVNIVAEPGIDVVTLNWAEKVLSENGYKPIVSKKAKKGISNLLLGVNGSRGIADKEATARNLNRDVFAQPKYDRHIVSLMPDANGVAQMMVLGENTDAAFYGISSIDQMLRQSPEELEAVVIYDYADQASRGVIEGYYGVPYSAAVTKDLFDFMARYKMNTYMYGAKSDPYHTQYWDQPYPDSITAEQEHIGYLTRDMLSDIAVTARNNKVNFIWAIHPGTVFTDSTATDVNDRIMNKFDDMYGLGVRQFGVFVDDVGVPYDAPTQRLNANRLTELQNMIDTKWNNGALNPADTVKPLQFVPQLYAFSWTTPEKAQTFFEPLSSTPEKIDIYITGAKVWSVPNNEDLEKVAGWLGRDVAWWWNYPCNDQDFTKLFPMDIYNNFADETNIDNKARLESDMKGLRTLIINPMQQGEISKIALFSVGDYAWNNAAFNDLESWNASLPAVVSAPYADALKKVVPYLRYYDQEIFGRLAYDYKQSVLAENPRPQPVIEELDSLLAACAELGKLEHSEIESDRLFYADMRPWLKKLVTMSQIAIDLLNGKDVSSYPDLDNSPEFQFEILLGMGDQINTSKRTAEPATQSLRELIDWMKSRQ